MRRWLIVAALLLSATRALAGSQSSIPTANQTADSNLATETCTQGGSVKLEQVVTYPSCFTTIHTNQVSLTSTVVAPIFGGATPCVQATIKADQSNVGTFVAVGLSSVATTTGFKLYPGDALTVAPSDGVDCATINVVSGTTGDAVSVIAK